MTHSDRALKFFFSGYNCAQATAAAFAEEIDIPVEDIVRMMAGFGGGIGGLRETCGAVSAMVFVTGNLFGHYDPLDNNAKKNLYDLVKDVNREFTERFGTTCCRELLQKAGTIPKPDPSERNAEYYAKRPCAHFVGAAADIVANRLRIHMEN